MTVWDVLSEIMKNLPPIAAMLFFLVAGVIFAIGFFRHGLNFIKYGFKQNEVDDLGKKIDGLDTRLTEKINSLDTRLTENINGLDTRLSERINNLGFEFHTELEAIKTNHFGHLKNFLSELTSILLDKDIINNTDKTRLDNQLRDM